MIVVGVICCTLGFMLLQMLWIVKGGLKSYTVVWSTIFLVFMVVMLILFYVGGRERIREEKELAKESLQR